MNGKKDRSGSAESEPDDAADDHRYHNADRLEREVSVDSDLSVEARSVQSAGDVIHITGGKE